MQSYYNNYFYTDLKKYWCRQPTQDLSTLCPTQYSEIHYLFGKNLDIWKIFTNFTRNKKKITFQPTTHVHRFISSMRNSWFGSFCKRINLICLSVDYFYPITVSWLLQFLTRQIITFVPKLINYESPHPLIQRVIEEGNGEW